MKTYTRPKFTLDDYESLPYRESIHTNIKQYQDYWDYVESYSSHTRQAYIYLGNLTNKYIGKSTKKYVAKIKNHPKYKKSYLFRNVAKNFLESVLNRHSNYYNYCYYNIIDVDGILHYYHEYYKLTDKVFNKNYEVYFQFIKYVKQATDPLFSVDSAYFIYKDKYYIGEINYKSLKHNTSIKLLENIKSISNFKNIKEVDKDLKLDLQDYLNAQ